MDAHARFGQSQHRLLRNAVTNGSGADNVRAVCDCRGKGGELFSGSQNGGSANRRASFAEGAFVGFDDAEPQKTKVAHSASNCAEVEGITRAHEYNAETIECEGA